MDTYTKAHMFLYYLKEGKGYKTSVHSKIICVKRTNKKIVLSNGVKIHLKKKNGMLYFYSASVVRGNKRYEYLEQVLRDIQGYLIYKLHANFPVLS
jgi:hypothetical protein